MRQMAARKKSKRHNGPSRWGRRLFFLLAGFALLSVLLVLPLRWVDPPTTAFMLQDDSGREPLLQEWLIWEQLGTAPKLAVVASEDQRFADHFGLDIVAVRKALAEQDDRGYLRGASTITQQTVKNLYLWPGRSYLRKGLEAWLTVVAELCLSKRRILEIYLNIAEFGPGIYGVAAASDYYFRMPPAELSDWHAALLAAVLPNPMALRINDPSDYLLDRRDWIVTHIARLRREGWLTRL